MSAKLKVMKAAQELGAQVIVHSRRDPLEVEVAAPKGKVFAASDTTLLVVSQDGSCPEDREAVWTTLLADLKDGVR